MKDVQTSTPRIPFVNAVVETGFALRYRDLLWYFSCVCVDSSEARYVHTRLLVYCDECYISDVVVETVSINDAARL